MTEQQEQQQQQEAQPPRYHNNFICCAPTFYPNTDDLRYKLGEEACREVAKHRIRLILIDASPNEEVVQGLENAGNGYVRVVKQTSIGKKGVALREAIQTSYEELLSSATGGRGRDSKCKDSIIAFMELEKVDLVQYWNPLIQHMIDESSDICVPKRSDQSFKKYYPIEQYHSENFVNMYLDCLAKNTIGLNTSIDWTCGPVAFRSHLVNHWLNYDGDLWDVQLVPLINAFVAMNGAKVTSFEVDYQHPSTMKEQEEFSPIWCEKRLFQINTLKDTVGARMKEISQVEALQQAEAIN